MHKILKPAMGKDGKPLKVHNPATKLFLKESGQSISLTTYWRRRLACGDVVEVKEVKEEPKQVEPKKAEQSEAPKTSKKKNNNKPEVE